MGSMSHRSRFLLALVSMAMIPACGGVMEESASPEERALEEISRGEVPSAEVHASGTCGAAARCSDGTIVSCSGTSNCYSFTLCYATCDGVDRWCKRNPGQAPPCP
jgi:hypothetical protein